MNEQDRLVDSFKRSVRLYVDEAPITGPLKRKRTRANGEGSIRPKGKGYEGRVTVGKDTDGKPIRKSVSGKTKKECREKMEAMKNTYAKQKDQAFNPNACPTLSNWLSAWLNEYRKDLAFSTRKRYAGLIEKLESYPVAHAVLNEVKPIELQMFINDFSSYETCRRSISMFNEAFRLAVDNGYLTRNLASGIRNPLKPPQPTHEENEKALTQEEENRFIEAIQDNPYRVLYLISLYAGLRRGEVCALTWKNVDLSKRIISVKAAATRNDRGYTSGSTKTACGIRTVPIQDKLYSILRTQRDQDGFIYENRGGMLNPDILTSDFIAVMNSLHMKHTLHQLRHTFATRCMEKGINVKVVQSWMGHAKVDMTMNTYTHATADILAAELTKLNN